MLTTMQFDPASPPLLLHLCHPCCSVAISVMPLSLDSIFLDSLSSFLSWCCFITCQSLHSMLREHNLANVHDSAVLRLVFPCLVVLSVVFWCTSIILCVLCQALWPWADRWSPYWSNWEYQRTLLCTFKNEWFWSSLMPWSTSPALWKCWRHGPNWNCHTRSSQRLVSSSPWTPSSGHCFLLCTGMRLVSLSSVNILA